MEYNDRNATVLSRKEVYPNGGNCPTIVTEYACACGAGKVVEEHISGFGEYSAKLQCEHCAEKYYLRTGCGNLWEYRERDR